MPVTSFSSTLNPNGVQCTCRSEDRPVHPPGPRPSVNLGTSTSNLTGNTWKHPQLRSRHLYATAYPNPEATTQMQRDWAFVTVLSAFLVAVVMPLWLRKTRSGPDWIRRTLGLWYFCGLSGLLMPFAVALVQGMDELRTLSLIQRMSFEAQHQASFTTSLVETFSVPFFAVVSLMGALIGSRVAACRRGPIAQTQHLVRIASRTLTNLSSYTRSFRGCSDPHATEPSDTCSETSHASSSSSSSSEGSPKSSVGALPGIWL